MKTKLIILGLLISCVGFGQVYSLDQPDSVKYIHTSVFNLDNPLYFQASVSAGADDTITAGQTYQLEGTQAYMDSVVWTSSGTGTFDDDNSLTPVYTPSAADITAGSVTLTLTGYVGGQSATDVITLTISGPPGDNLLAYWNESFGIESDSTIILKLNGIGIDTIKLSSVDFSLSNGYIPLKTAATFTMRSANTIDTAFWNNDIYPTTVFQNIDYDSTTYFKIADHILNADSTEQYPARITEIALYSQATDANTYFGVPPLASDPVWVSSTGNDATGDGTRTKPYLTLATAVTNSGNNDTIYFMSGKYSNATYYSPLLRCVQGLGRVSIESSNTSYSLLSTNGMILNNLRITSNGLGQYAIFINTNHTVTFNNIVVDGYTRYSFFCNAGETVNANQCVFTVGKASYNIAQSGLGTFKESLFINDAAVPAFKVVGDATSVYNFEHNDFRGTYNVGISVSTAFASIRAVGNNIYNDGIFLQNTGNFAGKYTVRKNIYNGGQVFVNITTTAVGAADVSYNNITSTYNGTGTLIAISGRNVTVNNNVITNIVKTGYATAIALGASTDTEFTVETNYNTIYSNNAGGSILVGAESYADSLYYTGTIIGNKIYGPGYYNVTDGSKHGIFVYNNDGVSVKYNYINGVALAIVLKATGVNYTDGITSYNVIKDGRIVVKGTKNAKLYGNTIVNTGYDTECINITTNGAVVTTGTDIKNNILYSTRDDEVFNIEDDASVFTSDYNVIYVSDSTDVAKVELTVKDWEDWQTDGYEENSTNTNPSFVSATQLWPTSPFTGSNLGATYDDGLDITTNWPNVVTRQQGATWQIGAYVQE